MNRKSKRLFPRLAGLFSLLTNGILAAVVVGAAVPGTHRAVIPEAYGLSEIASRVWTDAPDRASELLDLSNASRQQVASFFNDAPPRPTLILCATSSCARAFGIGGNGLSISDMVVMVSPGGLTLGTLTHEMTHSRLHRSMGIQNLVRQPFPTWFDEGLATHVANHPRWSGQITATARDSIRKVRRFWQWDDAHRALGVGRAYRAAAAEVAEIDRQAGRAGLLELIARAEAGENFGNVLTEIIAR